MRSMRIIAVVAALVAGLLSLSPKAEAATLPTFPMVLPVGWGYTVQAGGAHTHVSGVRSSVDLGASGGLSVPVVAAAEGTVTVKGSGSFSRCYVIIQHADGWQTQYYHLKAIPAGLTNGQKVAAGQQIGMTGMPGSETCGRGSFRHVHFGLYRNGVEQPISGISLGGYRYATTSGNYCGYWTRERDGVIVADARRACLAVPSVTNNIVHPSTLTATGISIVPAPTRPVISSTNSIAPPLHYITDGIHSVNKRAWRTRCEAWSAGRRCFTDIWAVTVKMTSTGGYAMNEGWAFNNLTYTGMTKAAWGTHSYARTGTFTVDGRQWRTECGTAATGPDGCRSWIYATIYAAKLNQWGRYDVTPVRTWVLNHQVWFARTAPTLALAAADSTAARTGSTTDVTVTDDAAGPTLAPEPPATSTPTPVGTPTPAPATPSPVPVPVPATTAPATPAPTSPAPARISAPAPTVPSATKES